MIDIKEHIPHREPFLFVNSVIKIGEKEILARKVFHQSEPFFAGHYPGDPITPGVILCEAVFQTAAVLVLHQIPSKDSAKRPVLARIDDARFKAIALPEETLLIKAELREKYGKFFLMDGDIHKENGSLVLKVRFSLALT